MKNLSNNFHINQQGFSLIEILVAMVLSAVLVTGVIQMYLSGNESYRLQTEMARMQENQRLALTFLQRDIRKAGYFEGVNAPNFNPIPKFDVSVPNGTKDNDSRLFILRERRFYQIYAIIRRLSEIPLLCAGR